jgi:DNA-directed RNA polymerase specialized sigma24 family protein
VAVREAWRLQEVQRLSVAARGGGIGFLLKHDPAASRESGVSHPLPNVADFQLVQRCLDGDEDAARALLRDYRDVIVGVLVKRGAPIAEAEDTVNQLWSECLARENDKPGRLAGYNGECMLATYLNTVAFNLWLTDRRKRLRQAAILASPAGPGPESGAAGTASDCGRSSPADAPLITLLREAIEAGARHCSAEHFVVLQLVHFDRLLGRELATMFGCDESWISRMAKRAEKEWRAGILDYLSEREPLLVLRWEDFIEMCAVAAPSCLGIE